MNDREISRKLAEARKRQHLTQKDIAKALGVTHSAVSLWESGRRAIPLNLLHSYAQIVGVTIELGGNDE